MSSFNLPNKYDCHIHTEYSNDSNLSCEKILSIASQKKIKLIGIVDHNTIQGALKVKSLSEKYNVKIIPGSEIKTPQGEIIGLNLKKDIKSRDLLEVLKEIKNQNGIVVVPHPFRWNKSKLPINRIKDYVDYIEVYNGRNLTTFSNILAYRLAKKYGFRCIKGSDAHFGFEIGNSSLKFINWKGFIGFFMTGILRTWQYLIWLVSR